MSGVRMTKCSGSDDGSETENIWPFFGATGMFDMREVAAAQAPVQLTNWAAWIGPLGVLISMALSMERVEKTAVCG